MRIVRTDRALVGVREVGEYIARSFGKRALQEFRTRLSEWTKTIKEHPGVGTIDWEVSTADRIYLRVLIYRRSWMVYRVEKETIYIVDFYDTNKSVPSHRKYE